MSYPTSLPRPPIQAYPFMSLILSKFDSYGRCESQSISHIGAEEIAAMSSAEKVDGNSPPRFCPQEAVDAIVAISDENFGRLSSILDLGVESQTALSTKAELASYCNEQEALIRECFEHFTGEHSPEQAHAWCISALGGLLSVHWGALSDLYNDCQDDQKKAISDLFGGCFGFRLESLYSVQPPEIRLPAELMPVIQVDQRDGLIWCFNASKNVWQRDDVMQGQYLIEGRASTLFDGHALIATASTFDEALALATVYTKGITEKPAFSRITITECESGGTSISELKLTANLLPSHLPHETYRAKLSWNLDKLERLARPKSVEETFRTLIKIEKAVGVRWVKANRLEHDLGM